MLEIPNSIDYHQAFEKHLLPLILVYPDCNRLIQRCYGEITLYPLGDHYVTFTLSLAPGLKRERIVPIDKLKTALQGYFNTFLSESDRMIYYLRVYNPRLEIRLNGLRDINQDDIADIRSAVVNKKLLDAIRHLVAIMHHRMRFAELEKQKENA